jgi:ribose transport system permease protein
MSTSPASETGAAPGRDAPVLDPAAPEQRNHVGRTRTLEASLHLIRLGPLLVLIAFWVAMSFLSPYFLSTINFSNMLQAAAIPAALALGQLLVILTGGIDLSAGAAYVLVGVLGAKFTNGVTDNGFAVIVFMLAIGLLVGLINGVLVEYVRVASSFVVTLGTLSIVTGAVYIASSGDTVTGLPAIVQSIGGGYFGKVPIAAVVVAGLALIAAVATTCIRWGRWVYLIGNNREGAARAGIPVRVVCLSVFALSGLAAGVAGIFEAGLTNAGSPTVSLNSELDAITAVVIGGAALAGGRGTVWGTVIGSLMIETIHNALNLLDVNSNWEPVVLGAVLLLAVGMERGRGHLETQMRLLEARLAGDL